MDFNYLAIAAGLGALALVLALINRALFAPVNVRDMTTSDLQRELYNERALGGHGEIYAEELDRRGEPYTMPRAH